VCVSGVSESVEYNQKTMEEALKNVEEMKANLGGTEILKPLKHIYSQPCIPSQPRQVKHTHTHRHTHIYKHTHIRFILTAPCSFDFTSKTNSWTKTANHTAFIEWFG